MHYRWKFPETPDPREVLALETALGIPRLSAQLLVQRGYRGLAEAKRYLAPDLASSGHDPFLMEGMEKACERLRAAREKGEQVMVHGDYDADGITALAIFMRFFESIGISATPYIPKRFHEGYGLSARAVAEAASRKVNLIVTADCGIRAVSEIEAANREGIDVILTDHHEPGEALPKAWSILNPKQGECRYPDRDLSGAGIAWKLCQGLFSLLDGDGEDPANYLDLVCLGAIADVVPVRGENRAIIRAGLRLLGEEKRAGIRALRTTSALSRSEPMTYRDVAFVLAPRLNAAGRLGEADRAFRLLYTDDDEEALSHATWLEDENRQRRAIDSLVTEEVREILARSFDGRRDYAVVLSSAEWHPGVIGIVASRVVEDYYRPAVLIAVSDGVGRGSARSIPEFPIYGALAECSRHLMTFGGHSYAAGFKIDEREIEKFRDEFREVARRELEGKELVPELSIDLEIDSDSISLDLVRSLKAMEPFGPGNPAPVFCLRDVRVREAPRVLNRNTLKFSVESRGRTIDVVGFGKGDYIEKVRKGASVDIAGQIREETWRGKRWVGMKLEDVRLKEPTPG